MSPPARLLPEATVASAVRVGDRFREIRHPERTFRLVALVRPRSGIMHARPRTIEIPDDFVFVSCNVLGMRHLYERIFLA